MGLNKSISQCDIWLCNFEPQVGAEITKIRPAIVIDRDMSIMPHTRIIVPLTTWQDKFSHRPWMLKIHPSQHNGLHSISAINCLQIKSFDQSRFLHKLGSIEKDTLTLIGLVLNKIIS